MEIDPCQYLESVVNLAKRAGSKILELYQGENSISIKIKADHSPVTAADLEAHRIIKEGLFALTPTIPLISEEDAHIPYETRKTWSYYWLVDPLDGTKEFINRSGEFTVNIALIANSQPILGVIYAPLRHLCYYACEALGAFKLDQEDNKTSLQIQPWEKGLFKIVSSRRNRNVKLESLLQNLGRIETVYRGSALKFCLVAEGNADIYLRISPTSEWDSAAGQCIVEQAGGVVLDLNWNPLRYNTKSQLQNPSFIVLGDAKSLLPILKFQPMVHITGE